MIDDIESVEKDGYLQRKTTKGLWANRYFATQAQHLKYWHSKAESINKEPTETYLISEIKTVEVTGPRSFVLNFLNSSKFRLELSAPGEHERMEWVTLLEAKRRLYSVDELLADLRADRVSFRTKTFRTLMILPEKDQNKWILDRLDELFEIDQASERTDRLRADSCRLLHAAIRSLDEFLAVCRDCEDEISGRAPQVIAHSKNYMRRYTDIIKGRILLELLYLPCVIDNASSSRSHHNNTASTRHRDFESLGEGALCLGLEFLKRVEQTEYFLFVPRVLSVSIYSALFNFGDLISALLNLGMKRVDIFFNQLQDSSGMEQSRKLSEASCLLVESLQLVRRDLNTQSLYILVTRKILSTQVLAFADHINAMTLDNDTHYEDENSLFAHINAAQTLLSRVSKLQIHIESKEIAFANEYADSNSNIDSSDKGRIVWLKVPSAEIEALHFACDDSAYTAMILAINRLRYTRNHLLHHFFDDQAEGWIGGILISAWVNSLGQWADHIATNRLSSHITLKHHLHPAVGRMMIVCYVQALVDRHRANGKRKHLTKNGQKQLQYDLGFLLEWINKHEVDSAEGYLIEVILSFVQCNESNVMHYMAQAVQKLGLSSSLQLYDLLRLLLKLRVDVTDHHRKTLLQICGEFLLQIEHQAEHKDTATLLSGHPHGLPLMQEIFPHAGHQHCTGSKWKMERPHDPEPLRLTVALLITDLINRAVARGHATHQQHIPPPPLPSQLDTNHDSPLSESETSSVGIAASSSSTVRLLSIRRPRPDSTGKRPPQLPPPPPPPQPRRQTIDGSHYPPPPPPPPSRSDSPHHVLAAAPNDGLSLASPAALNALLGDDSNNDSYKVEKQSAGVTPPSTKTAAAVTPPVKPQRRRNTSPSPVRPIESSTSQKQAAEVLSEEEERQRAFRLLLSQAKKNVAI